MKILVLGHAQHGKNAVADILQMKFNLKAHHEDASRLAARLVVFPVMKWTHGYITPDRAYEDRREHRGEWHQLINEFCARDPARLVKRVLLRSDLYVGLRCPKQYAASRHLFDKVFWVDAHTRVPPEDTIEIAYKPGQMILIDNNGPIAELPGVVDAALGKLARVG